MSLSRDAQDRATKFPLYFVLASLLFHVLALLLLPQLKLPDASSLFEKETIVEIDPSLLEQMDKETQRQIVLTEPSKNNAKPEDSKYLSEHDQSVEKETKAKRVDTFQQASPSPGQKISLKNLAPAKPILQPLEKGDTEIEKKKDQAREAQERGGAMAATNDYLKDVSDGDRTLLNTREFIYFGYYHRIRQRLEQSWNTKLRTVLMSYVNSGRRLATDKNYVTRLVVVLDRNGKIIAVKILEESGARDLDDAAVEAFNRAGPFPNPPKGLIEKDGLIKIRWDFILQS